MSSYHKEQSKCFEIQKQHEIRMSEYTDKFDEIQMTMQYISNKQDD